ncbi:DEAD-box ATP-dependent RNA helicase [Vigna angularis]|uniref:DEAD-box ATP-dependent RNA helicase n=1 Tax=Phaseolus angularis TaxID=3914 RepID=A0A8T0KPG0_PHAAN|nr:DEAD-box ATP-dependent RNA helicase [Vigna angularis]
MLWRCNGGSLVVLWWCFDASTMQFRLGESLNPPVGLSPKQGTSQGVRGNVVDNFRAGKTWVLIATDVVARGMDFKGVNCVINYDFPDSASTYVHILVYAAILKAGRSGEAITFYIEEDISLLRNVANLMAASGCEVPPWLMELQKRNGRNTGPKEIQSQ